MPDNPRPRFAAFCIVLAAVFWGGLFVFVRAFGGAGFTSGEIVFLRCAFSALWLFFYVAFAERKNVSLDGSPALRLKLKDLWCFAGAGIISIVFFSWCYFKNVAVSSAAFAAVLMYTSPIFVMLISAILFKERITGKKLSALLLAVLGTALVSGLSPDHLLSADTAVPLKGLLLGLGSALGYALYSIFGSLALSRGYRPLVVTFYTFAFATLGSSLLVSLPSLLVRLGQGGLLPLALMMGLFGSCLPFALYTIGLSGTETGKAAILATLEPIVTALLGIILYGETLAAPEIIGIILILSGSTLVVR